MVAVYLGLFLLPFLFQINFSDAVTNEAYHANEVAYYWPSEEMAGQLYLLIRRVSLSVLKGSCANSPFHSIGEV